MNLNFLPPTEIELKRATWWAEHVKPGMSIADACHLNIELMRLFPKTIEERNRKAKEWEDVPEFVL